MTQRKTIQTKVLGALLAGCVALVLSPAFARDGSPAQLIVPRCLMYHAADLDDRKTPVMEVAQVIFYACKKYYLDAAYAFAKDSQPELSPQELKEFAESRMATFEEFTLQKAAEAILSTRRAFPRSQMRKARRTFKKNFEDTKKKLAEAQQATN